MNKPRAFVEAPAGLAAVSLYLHGGKYCRPPISRMGNKAGFSEIIAASLGLRGGIGAGAYVWCESDPDVRALLRAYPDADMLRQIADIIRGWKDEEPRALWERLRAERKARGPVGEPGISDASAWIYSAANAFRAGFPDSGIFVNAAGSSDPNDYCRVSADGVADTCHRLAEYASIVAEPAAAWAWLQSRSVGGIPASEGLPFYGPTMPAGDPKDALRGRRVATCDGVAQGFERVAGWSTLTAWTKQNDPNGSMYMGPDRPSACHEPGWVASITTDGLGRRYNNLASRWPPVAVLPTLPDAATLSALLGTPGDLDGVVVYSDPDYRDTTGYADTCREAIPDLARGWDAAGAVVCVSEAVPVPELTARGWHSVDITGGRKGQRRTFARVATEALTMNREPQHRVATQIAMFGGAA